MIRAIAAIRLAWKGYKLYRRVFPRERRETPDALVDRLVEERLRGRDKRPLARK